MASSPADRMHSGLVRFPWLRRLWRWSVYVALMTWGGFIAFLLLLRYLILPQIELYRVDLEQALSQALQLPVHIQRIEADWQGLRPHLALHQVEILDQQGRPALSFDNVDAVLGWRSVLVLEPRLHRLEIHSPNLSIRRDRDGHLTVAGLPVQSGGDQPGFADWVMKQDQLAITNARIDWTDELRGAPTLTLDQLGLVLENSGRHHRFGLTAQPPRALAARLDIRGDLVGRSLERLNDWDGELYAELDYADLAVWRKWVDYPIGLSKGSGALRLWLTVENLQPVGLTADLALTDVSARLAADLPELELIQASGRIKGRLLADGFEASTQGMSVTTADGVKLLPADLLLQYQPLNGRFEATQLDLGHLARLASHIPLPDEARRALQGFAPAGRLKDFRLSWSGKHSPAERYAVQGSFEGLSLAAHDGFPGASGLSGRVEGTERGGRLLLDSRDAGLDLPMVFPDPKLPLTSLNADVRWKQSGSQLEVLIDKVAFANNDAEGSAQGTYRLDLAQDAGKSRSGVIDLDAHLSRAEATAVWRYLPLVVGPDTRNWLKTGLPAGRASNGVLKLKGDLDHFPFRDGSGIFRITGKAEGVNLKPAPDWPLIEDIRGDLLFEGARMRITGHQGQLMGAQLSGVVADLPDIESDHPVMTITGKAKGETAAFLRFLEGSPVGGLIDHFTEDMTAKGNGELDLKLIMPLNKTTDTQVAGSYRFDNNRLQVAPGVPVFDEVRGRLDFTEKGLVAKDVRAKALGGPMSVDVRTGSDGAVAVDGRGEINIAQLRTQQPALPLLDNLSGTSRWEGTVRVKKRNPEIRISTDLRGITSTLPEPFNKPATDARPLVVERKLVETRFAKGKPQSRELWDINLARALRIQLWRGDGGKGEVDQGLLQAGNGPLPRLPEKGFLITGDVPRVDVDFWRRAWAAYKGSESKTEARKEASAPALLSVPVLVDVKTGELAAAGRSLHEVKLAGGQRGEHWIFDLRAKELGGRLDWTGEGRGKLVARIGQLNLPALPSPAAGKVAASAPSSPSSTQPASGSSDDLDQLPALDLSFERLIYGGRDFGEVHVTAENRNGLWVADFSAQAEDGGITGEGRWKPDPAAPDTYLDFKLKTKSIEKTLERIGYPNAVKRGAASIEGKLSWNGVPYAPDYPSLNGHVSFSAEKGQFRKLEPGMGRMLGILSLQSLPRRITLDFRDVFSEGFAFDAIEGKAQINRGILETDDLTIRGPAAQVAMKGNIDLARETQNLRVRVQPALGESVATGVLLVHPVTGLTTWAINKLFGRPLDQIFAFEYAITGAWDDPKVEKLGGATSKPASGPAAAPEKAGEARPAESKPAAAANPTTQELTS